ncbi:MAG TPA: response regulator transcription factor [Bacteroidales bacterium]|nr:response regulator transcription factor [Bacteroidales bacterium]
MSDKPVHILVVDDEEDLCEILQFNLEAEGFRVDVAYSAEEAIQRDLKHFDLFILDIMMGHMSGFKLADYLKKELGLNVPLIFLTAKDTENDILTGFTLGADDYISKPFSIRQLVARVKAVLRRAGENEEDKNQNQGKLTFEGLELDLVNKHLVTDNVKTELTPKEFEILRLLIGNPGTIYSREEILARVWPDDVIVNERNIDVNIARIRKKMGPYADYLKNRTGYGYFFNTD